MWVFKIYEKHAGIFFLVEELPEGGYSAKALGEAIFTEADSLDEIRENIKDTVKCHFDD